jgi:small subunit ribosomal protein S2
MKELLEAGVHFGHQTRRWDPRMKTYIFTERNGIHIIDLQKTIAQLKIAYNAIKELAKGNGTLLFIGTKRQAQSAITEQAARCGMPFVTNRWLGGMLTNFTTIQKSIQRLKKIERMEVDGSFEFMTKKEVIGLNREKDKLLKNIGGVKDLEVLPDMVFIIDPKKEAIAVAEAMRLKIPIVSIIDTNCNPEGIDYPIPGNDDAIRAINLFSAIVSSAVIEGQNEAGKIEITEETQIMSLEEEERARAERSKAEEVEGYLSDEDLVGAETPAPSSAEGTGEGTNPEEAKPETEAAVGTVEQTPAQAGEETAGEDISTSGERTEEVTEETETAEVEEGESSEEAAGTDEVEAKKPADETGVETDSKAATESGVADTESSEGAASGAGGGEEESGPVPDDTELSAEASAEAEKETGSASPGEESEGSEPLEEKKAGTGD